MKRIKNNGFSLLEIMVAIGIFGTIFIVISSLQKSSLKTNKDLTVNSEVNKLIQQLTSQLNKQDICLANFSGKVIVRTLPNVIDNRGTAIITAGQKFGDEITIGTINTTNGSIANQMNLTVNYTPLGSPTAKKFVIPINVFLDSGTGLIKSCYSDLQSLLRLAVQYACQGNGARWIPATGSGIGSCEHEVELRNASNGVVPPVANGFVCPAGQFIQQVDTGTVAGKWIFRCSTVSLGCTNAWEYLKGIDSSGNPICSDVRTLFSTTGFMVIQSGVFQAFPITCPAGQVLQTISGAGTVNCINPNFNYSCPVNKYVKGINADGSVNCQYSTDSNACAAGSSYIKAIDAAGNVTCGSGAPPNSCAASQYISGFDGSGNVICSAMP
jgi:prepilin-type N-terminal cleavage/methylation domain-containing protein